MKDAVILNGGSGAWAFETLARNLSCAFGVPVSETPAAFNYVLAWDGETPPTGRNFIPWEAIAISTDKRELKRVFSQNSVPSPATFLMNTPDEMRAFLQKHQDQRWVLKWPIGCGGAGHRFIIAGDEIADDWPRPFVVQRFVELKRPEVFRLYCVAGQLFGWNARRFSDDLENPSPFVAHARGAFYEDEGRAPAKAVKVARLALQAAGLLDSFGCADLLMNRRGNWLALEVNTDGRWMHVDRETLPAISEEIEERLAKAFAAWRANI